MLKSCLAIALFGLSLCYAEVALSATPAKPTTPGDQPSDLAQNSAIPQRARQKNPDTNLPQKPSEKARDVRPPVMSEPLGPFSPLHIDP